MVPNQSPPLDPLHRHSTIDELVAATEFMWCNVPQVQDITNTNIASKVCKSEDDMRRKGADQIESREPREEIMRCGDVVKKTKGWGESGGV